MRSKKELYRPSCLARVCGGLNDNLRANINWSAQLIKMAPKLAALAARYAQDYPGDGRVNYGVRMANIAAAPYIDRMNNEHHAEF